MADEYNDHMVLRILFGKKKKNIRVFIRRKRLSSGISHTPNLPHSKSIEELTSVIKKSLKTSTKKTSLLLIINQYLSKLVRQNSLDSKPIPTNRRHSLITSNHEQTHHFIPNRIHHQFPSMSPGVEDPLMFIEMMYQQLFTDDGQLRSETEPEVLANCVKQIVTHSRRNSIAQRRDSDIKQIFIQQKRSSTSLSSSSPRFIPNIFNEEEEEEDPNTLLQRT